MLGICVGAFQIPTVASFADRIDALGDKQWGVLTTNRFEDAWPDPLQYNFEGDPNPSVRGSPHAVINAWSSFAWDSRREQIILFGGGHANYAGNEIYLWKGDSGAWERGSVPSDIQRVDGTYEHTVMDGAYNAPQSSHTYGNNRHTTEALGFLLCE